MSTGRQFPYKNKEEFAELDDGKKAYYLARLYIRQDRGGKSSLAYKARLFSCVNYIKKQPREVMSVLYNYLKDNTHDGLPIWQIMPKAVLYDQRERRHTSKQVCYEEYNEDMLNEILGEDKT